MLSKDFDRIELLIKKFDIDLKSIEVDEKSSIFNDNDSNIINESKYKKVVFLHRNIKNEIIKFDLKEESEGTRSLYFSLPYLLDMLEKGGAIVIDELEQLLQPLIMRKIIEIFKSKEYNKKMHS